MIRFVQHLDRDLLTLSASSRCNASDALCSLFIRAFRVDIEALFKCDNPELKTPRELVNNINQHIIDTFVSERKSILDELYPDLHFPPNFWRSIYIDFEFGDIDYRVFHHYHQWTINQIKYKSFPMAFICSNAETILWLYMLLLLFHVLNPDHVNDHITSTAFALFVTHGFHLIALYLSITEIFSLYPTLKSFDQHLKRHLNLRSDSLPSDSPNEWTWILTLSVQRYLSLSYPLRPIEITSPPHTLNRYAPSSILNNRVIVPLGNRFVLLMATFKSMFGLIVSLFILNNFYESAVYGLFNAVFFVCFMVLQMGMFGVVLITNYEIPPMTALTVILMAVSCSLLAYGLIVIILYFADRQVLEQTAHDEHNWFTDTLLPIVFLSCWMMTVYKVYWNWNGYHQWLWMMVSLCCLFEILQESTGTLWIVQYHKDVFCCATFMALMAVTYIEYQHRMHHAFTCLKHRHYVSQYITNHHHQYRYQWIKNCIYNLLLGQLYSVNVELDKIEAAPVILGQLP